MKGKIVRRIVISFTVLLLYLLFFPQPLGKEIFLSVKWVHQLDSSPLQPESTKPLDSDFTSFLLGDTLGYLDEQGRLLYKEKVLHGAVVLDKGFINYSSLPQNIIIKDPRGKIIASTKAKGYPFSRRDKLFLLSFDGCSLAEITAKGALVWEKDFNELITAVDATSTQTIIGLWDGRVFLIGEKGKVEFSEQVANLPYNIIYAVILSEENRWFGAVYGLNPQRIGIWERTPSGFKQIRSFQMETQLRRPVKGWFESFQHALLIETEKGVQIVGRKDKQDYFIPFSASLHTLFSSPIEGILAISVYKSDSRQIWGVSSTGSKVFLKSFPMDKNFYIKRKNQYIVIGIGTYIIQVSMELG